MKAKAEPQEAAVESGVWQGGKLIYQLRKAVPAHGDEVSSLTLREPTALDLIEIGDAVKFDPSAEIGADMVAFDMPRMVQLLARLASVPTSSIQRLDLHDLNQLRWTVAPFFNPL